MPVLPTPSTVLCLLQCRPVPFFVFLQFFQPRYTGFSQIFYTVHQVVYFFGFSFICFFLAMCAKLYTPSVFLAYTLHIVVLYRIYLLCSFSCSVITWKVAHIWSVYFLEHPWALGYSKANVTNIYLFIYLFEKWKITIHIIFRTLLHSRRHRDTFDTEQQRSK